MQRIGITERGDAALDWVDWWDWVSDGQPAILITKDPQKLSERLTKIDNPKVIVHATITGWGGTPLEPNVPEPELALRGFADLVARLGPDRFFPDGRPHRDRQDGPHIQSPARQTHGRLCDRAVWLTVQTYE